MKFFFDNCISSKLAHAMQLLNKPQHEIEHLTDRFNADDDDEVWIPKVAAEGDWILISADPAITTSAKEKEIWRMSGLTAFFFTGAFPNEEKWAQIIEVTRWWPEIVRTAKEAKPGTGYRLPYLSKKGPVEIYKP